MDQAAAKAGQGAPRCALPAAVGVGFKPQHFAAIEAAGAGAVAFFEVHAENYFVAGGPLLHQLDWLAARYPLSIHGVGASLAGPHPPPEEHLAALSALLARTAAASFSEHLAWSSAGGIFLDDLLAVPYDGATLRRLCAHVERVQERLGRRLLLENPATYVEFSASTWSEPEFLAEVVRRTGCGLLLDLNNLYVSCVNHHRDPLAELERFPLEAVAEVHLAGHAQDWDDAGDPLLIDSHDRPVAEPVWALYAALLDHLGPLPTLIEWDGDLPPWPVLEAEARRAADLVHRQGKERAS
ncbi:MAG: UPF0276 protein [Porticoccaceae bacterium]|nr:MAG: UPF0276 protein [Porticoccaceae bacterium]